MTYPEGRFCWIKDRREVQLTSDWSNAGVMARGTHGKLFYSHYLFASAVNVPRNILSNIVSAKRAARVKGARSPEYEDGANTRFWKSVNDTRQVLPRVIHGTGVIGRKGLYSWSFNLFTHQSPCLPFQSGVNVLPGLEAWVKRHSKWGPIRNQGLEGK